MTTTENPSTPYHPMIGAPVLTDFPYLTGVLLTLLRERWGTRDLVSRLSEMTMENAVDLTIIESMDDAEVRLFSLYLSDAELRTLANMIGNTDWHPEARSYLATLVRSVLGAANLLDLQRTIQTARDACWEATENNSGCDDGKRSFLLSTGLFDEEEVEEMFVSDWTVTLTYFVSARSEEDAVEQAEDGRSADRSEAERD